MNSYLFYITGYDRQSSDGLYGSGGGGGGGQLALLTRMLRWLILGVQNFEFQVFWDFRKMNIFGGMKILWIFFGGWHQKNWTILGGSLLCILGSFFLRSEWEYILGIAQILIIVLGMPYIHDISELGPSLEPPTPRGLWHLFRPTARISKEAIL